MSYRDGLGQQHGSQYEAELANEGQGLNKDGSAKSGGGGGVAEAGGGLLVMVFLFGPIIVAKVAGLLFGLFSKLGITGKILQTISVLLASIFIFPFAFMGIGVIFGKGIGLAIMIGIIVLPTFWFFLWHYDEVKQMGSFVFSELLKTACSVSWFGYIGAVIIGFFTGSQETGLAVATLASTVGVIYYIIKTRPFAKEVKPDSAKMRVVKITVMLIVAGIVTVIGIITAIQTAQREAESKNETAAFIENLLATLPDFPYTATVVTGGVPGQRDSFFAYEGDRIFQLDNGNVVTVTGIQPDGRLDVEYQGRKLTVRQEHIEKIVPNNAE